MDKRSNRYAFVAFCTLAQGVRAQSLVRTYPAVVQPVIELLVKQQFNIWQMPCPELFFDSFCRRPCGKQAYDRPEFRKEYMKVAGYIGRMCQMLEKAGNQVELVLGVERSPSCAISKLAAPGGPHEPRIISGEGIFIEELKKALRNLICKPQYVGVDTLHIGETMRVLERLTA